MPNEVFLYKGPGISVRMDADLISALAEAAEEARKATGKNLPAPVADMLFSAGIFLNAVRGEKTDCV